MSKLSKRDFVCLLVLAMIVGQFVGFLLATLLDLGPNVWAVFGVLAGVEIGMAVELLDRYLPRRRTADLPPLPVRSETTRRIWSRQARFSRAGKSMLDNLGGSSCGN